MSITDELREYTEKQIKWLDMSKVHYRKLFSIADRIDAEHERECKEQYACGVEHGIGASIDASMIQMHGYVELPKDADGEYIRIGDVMEYPNGGREEVRFMTLNGAGWLVNEAGWLPVQLHHHHAPTVEDVLREMHAELDEVTALYVGEVIDSDERDRDEARIFAEFAAKLRLAGGEDK